MAWKRSDSSLETIRVPLVILCASALIMIWHAKDISQSYSWIIFGLWCITFIASLLFVYLQVPKSFAQTCKSYLKRDLLIIIGIIFFAGFFRFVLMSQYPYQALGDEIRDSGLNAYKILWGQTKDMFGLGDYNGYGNFIPLLAYPFIFIFGNSVFMYRVPAAIIGVTSIVLVYIMGRIYWGRKVGIAAALLLSVSIFHLHYSRVELLVILDSFLGMLAILSYMVALKNRYGVFFFGLICGFIMHFYAGVRGILIILISFSVCYYGMKLLRKIWNASVDYRHELKVVMLVLFLYIAGFLIAVGPTLKVSIDVSSQNTGVSPPIYKQEVFLKLNPQEKIVYLVKLYTNSFLIYTYTVTNDEHISYHTTLLPIPINWVFVVGLIVFGYMAVKKKSTASALLLFLAFLFPVTNEVSVNHAGADHRLMSIMGVLYIIAAVGLVEIVRKISFGYTRTVLAVCVVVFSAFQLQFYFVSRPSDFLYQFKNGKDYIFQHILESAQEDEAYSIYILNDPEDYIFPQYVEKMRFFLMGKFYVVLNQKEFMTAMRENMRARNKNAAFYIFNSDQLIDGVEYTEFTVSCKTNGFLPAYECPIDREDSYSYFRVKGYK